MASFRKTIIQNSIPCLVDMRIFKKKIESQSETVLFRLDDLFSSCALSNLFRTVLRGKGFAPEERKSEMNKPREKGQKSLGRSLPKGRGKEVDFRSKKQKNELHILKMSQEWDLRRQKRRLDRQKWVEERRNQKLPIWQRVGNLRVQANEEIAHDASNELVNKKQQIIENSNEATQIRVKNDDKVKENSLEPRGKPAFLVQTSHSSESVVSVEGTGFSTGQKKDIDAKFIKIEQARTMEQPLQYNVSTLKTSKTSTQITEHGPITAFKSSSKSPSKQDGEHHESGKPTEIGTEVERRSAELTSVALQKFLRMERANGESEKVDRKRKLEAIVVDGDIGDIRPTLMRVNKPTTLENIERENGPVAISSSPNTSVPMKPTRGGVNQTENGKGEEMMPQIKQCYSLFDRREESPNVNFFAGKKSPSKSTPTLISRASPVTTTTSQSEVKGQAASSAVPVDPKCIVYLAKAPAPVPTPGTPNQPRPGYLVPVFKASTREAAYAFLPAGAQRIHRVGDKPALEGHSPNRKNECANGDCTTVIHHATRIHPSPNSKTGLKEMHTKCVPATGKFVSASQGPPSLYSDHTHHNTRVHSCYDPISTSVTLNPSRTDSAYSNGGRASGSSKNPVVNIQKTTTAYCVGSPRTDTISSGSAAPLAPEIKGSGGKISPRDKPHYPGICRTPEIAPNQTAMNAQDPIFNPMSVYVRAKLVPREVVAVNHGAEPTSPPLVEYIKTVAICDKELTKWTAQNVADFIAATDCADKAELFLEQEIDGKALLSLSPEMLMKGMNLKLGPSVKLYNHIANLRTALLL